MFKQHLFPFMRVRASWTPATIIETITGVDVILVTLIKHPPIED